MRSASGVAGPSAEHGAEFVARFADFWRAPTPERLGEVLTDDVTLAQPLTAPTHGLLAARAAFAHLFVLVPDLHAVVERWSARGEHVFIEFRLCGTVGGRAVEWPAVDRFTLRGERACERVSYFDPTPLLPHLARQPLAALRWWWTARRPTP